ncbi:MAG: MarR family transcriptional regulator [Thermoanaerobaculaceae bacterium]|nr:MarR family transcriptional regulator [Thermoanaerobaculaceae bacterium]TAM51078.1 MAG: MarR family transcriptional regulator [Acidobacteriota bacterium]
MAAARTTKSKTLRHRGDESHLLREIVRTNRALMTEFPRKVGMAASRLALVQLVATADRDIGVMELARQLGINPAGVTRQVKLMEREGLIERYADPGDRRRSTVKLSPQGARLFGWVHEKAHDLERSLTAAVGPQEMAIAAAVLAKVRALVEELP